jgi:SAM-dependent methyltransferase
MTVEMEVFLTALQESIRANTLVKLTLGNPASKTNDLKKILIKPVLFTRGDYLNCVYRHTTKDVTKNIPFNDGPAFVSKLLGSEFLSGHLFTTTKDIELIFKKEETYLRITQPSHTSAPSKEHNRSKKRPIVSQGTPYLPLLGVTNPDGSVKKGMEAKYRQINKFIEIVDPLIRSSSLKSVPAISVLDMGSGKGYLTFALYDYLTHTLNKNARVTGVELRKELVDFCNGIAQKVGYAGLTFTCGGIRDFASQPTDVLIALHACNTATDEAIFQGIKNQAALILCAPCCHKELRPQMACTLPSLQKVLQHGILLERQAELLTDGLRALLLEAHGYKTSVFEFIATEHTSKNIMIAAIKNKQPPNKKAIQIQIDSLKNAFGIETQYLEKLLLAHEGEAGEKP